MKMKNIDMKSIKIILILILFVLGLIFVTSYKHIKVPKQIILKLLLS